MIRWLSSRSWAVVSILIGLGSMHLPHPSERGRALPRVGFLEGWKGPQVSQNRRLCLIWG